MNVGNGVKLVLPNGNCVSCAFCLCRRRILLGSSRRRSVDLKKCADCSYVDFMPRYIFSISWSKKSVWIDAEGTGTINSFSIIHRSSSPVFRDRCPYVVALIDLTEGPRMITNIVGEDALSVAIGDALEICFGDRGFTRVPQFQRVQIDKNYDGDQPTKSCCYRW